MSGRPVRVALFPDSLNEVNGVANTCRNWLAYVHRNQFPMLVVSAADKTEFRQEGTISRLDLKRGPISFSVEKDLRFDVALAVHQYHYKVIEALREFRPEVVHITGPGDIGMMGAITAHKLGIPVAASWQTNIHEYAARRANLILPRFFSGRPRARFLQTIEDLTFRLAVAYYKAGRFHYAPNQELIDKLSAASGRPCSLMERGVDLDLFNPAHRSRGNDGQFVIGYVGRLSTEKKVRSLAGLAKAVKAAGYDHVKFVFVGHGAEEEWLSKNIPNVEMTGVLRGAALGRAYANMDLFAFYSETDTFGNVVLEALASGVPAVVTDKGGPKFIVDHERCGFVCSTDDEFNASVLRLIGSSSLQCDMAIAARQRAQRASWDEVFDSVYDAYRRHLPNPEETVNPRRFHGKLGSATP
jgi:glycosyltransferase involved in cell wall biosynthesis